MDNMKKETMVREIYPMFAKMRKQSPRINEVATSKTFALFISDSLESLKSLEAYSQ